MNRNRPALSNVASFQEPNETEASRRAYLRTARPSDAATALKIYAFYVENTTISFEYESPTLAEFEGRIRAICNDFPYLVYCSKNKRESDVSEEIVGFAYAHRAFERAAYAWDAEATVYVDRNFQGRGVGGTLYRALISILQAQGFRNVYAVVTSENRESVDFHLKNGFRLAGTLRDAGFKNGRWLDVDRYERRLGVGDFDANPVPPVPFSRLDSERIAAIFADSVGR